MGKVIGTFFICLMGLIILFNHVEVVGHSSGEIAKFEYVTQDGYIFKLENGEQVFISFDDLSYDEYSKYDLMIIFDKDNEWEIEYMEVIK